jgi:hypothetical protein
MQDCQWATLRLTNIQAAVGRMDREMAPHFITSDGGDMAAESDCDLSCSRDEVSTAEEVHSFPISIDIKVVLGEIVSNIGTTDRQWDE